MKNDYYTTLGINRDAKLEDVKKAFRKKALKYHPEKNPTRQAEATEIFAQVAEAYDVLSNTKLRVIFDQYGEQGLKNGGTGDFGVPGGYKFSADPEKVFQRFFGVDNPFEQIGDFSAMQGTEHQFLSKEGARNKDPPKCEPLEVDLECTLEELQDGAFKVVNIDTKKLNEAGNEVGTESKEIDVKLAKGCAKDTKIVFEKKGTTRDGHITGDVILTVKEKVHPRFSRKGDDLLITFDITLEQALCGFPIEVATLDGRKLNIFINQVVHLSYVKQISGEGMPKADGTKGDLLITFNTTFPKYLTAEQQKEIKRILNAKE